MKAGRLLGCFLIAVFFMSCTSLRERGDEVVPLQETKIYDGFTFDQIWNAVLLSVSEIEFTVQKEIRESGFIYAQEIGNSDGLYPPPHMNIIIREENNRIRVSCHAVVPGKNEDYEASSGYVTLFFTAMARNVLSSKHSRIYFFGNPCERKMAGYNCERNRFFQEQIV